MFVLIIIIYCYLITIVNIVIVVMNVAHDHLFFTTIKSRSTQK